MYRFTYRIKSNDYKYQEACDNATEVPHEGGASEEEGCEGQ